MKLVDLREGVFEGVEGRFDCTGAEAAVVGTLDCFVVTYSSSVNCCSPCLAACCYCKDSLRRCVLR